LGSEDKIKWLVDNDILLPEKYGLYADFEVYEILGAELKNTSNTVKKALINYIQQKDGRVDEGGNEHTWDQYELCCWIANIRNDWEDAINPLVLKYKQVDSWATDLKPQKRSFEAGLAPEAPSAMDANDFIAKANSNPQNAIDELFATPEYEKRWGNDISGIYNLYFRTICDAVESDAIIAIRLWDLDFQKTTADKYKNKIKLAIIGGLKKVPDIQIFMKMLPRLLKFVCEVTVEDYQMNRILCYVHETINKNKGTFQTDIVPSVVELCKIIWERFNSNFENQYNTNNLTSRSPNFWPCSMIAVLLNLLELHNREAEIRNIPEDIQKIFDTVLITGNQAAQYAVLKIFMDFRFAYWCEEDYGIKKLMPIINAPVQNDTNSWYAWSGFLFKPNYDNKMLGEGLFEAICKLQPDIFQVFPDSHTQYFKIVLKVLSYSSIKNKKRSDLLNAIAKDDRSSAELIHCIVEEIVDGNTIWGKWVRKFILDRLLNRPVKLSDNEFWEIYNLSFVVGEKITEIANAIIRSKYKLNFNSTVGHGFHLPVLDTWFEKLMTHQQAFVDLICYLLSNHQGQIDHWSLQQISNIREKVTDDYKTMIDNAINKAGVVLPPPR
jgi:hypothetical protein